MAQRVILFVDEQNFYQGARRAFYNKDSHFTRGNFHPVELGRLICARLPIGVSEPRSLHQVRVYTGLTDPTKEPKSHAPHMKRCSAWEAAGAVVIARPLRYPKDWKPSKPGEQKGVDVALAIDFVDLALDGEYNVGVIASTDSDLRPALEFVLRRFPDTRRVEVASWWNNRSQSRLTVPGASIWCHRLDENDYKSVADLTDYAT